MEIYCIRCGDKLNDSMNFCPNCGNKIVFPPYNTEQLSDILQERSKLSFINGSIDDSVIPLCSAMAAKEEGNIRYALDLLQTAGEIADEKGSDIILGAYVKEAKERIEYNKVIVNTNSEPKLLQYSTVDFVDFYETRAVRHSRGGSYNMGGGRIYGGESYSTQEWTKLGKGEFTLGGSKSYFVGGGQQRTIDTKKIVNVTYFSDKAGIEVSVSNRQKSMKFMLPGRTIEDGQRLADAVLKGEKQVVLTESKNTELKDSGGCYIATYVYGSYDATEVLILRDFRDEKLLTNYVGTLFVKFYYKISPFLIRHFSGKIFKNTTKKFLDYIVKKLN